MKQNTFNWKSVNSGPPHGEETTPPKADNPKTFLEDPITPAATMTQLKIPADPKALLMAPTIPTMNPVAANFPIMNPLAAEVPAAAITTILSAEAPYSDNILDPTVPTTTPLAA